MHAISLLKANVVWMNIIKFYNFTIMLWWIFKLRYFQCFCVLEAVSYFTCKQTSIDNYKYLYLFTDQTICASNWMFSTVLFHLYTKGIWNHSFKTESISFKTVESYKKQSFPIWASRYLLMCGYLNESKSAVNLMLVTTFQTIM